MNKTTKSLADAIGNIFDGATIMIGGFGGSGSPIELIHSMIAHGAKDLTIINNNAGNGHVGLTELIEHNRVRKIICSYPRSSNATVFNERYLSSKIELEIMPQDTLAERIRAGGAGIPAFYTPTSFGTDLAKNKPIAEFDGQPYVQERWLKADFALIKAEKADPHGNLTYRMATRSFNPLMAMAANRTIAQSGRIVPLGSIDADKIITPGVFVDSVIEVLHPIQEEILPRKQYGLVA